jgi:oligoribonuclease NrnB/cAMP/cGMP phosphodiesterase (DHH superfamily)
MIISITHGQDLDGIGAQAILLRHWDINRKIELDNIELEYAIYSNFIPKLKKIVDSDLDVEELYITDLGFNTEFMAVFPLFEKLIEKGCKIYWFDHHIVDEDIKNRLKELIEVYLNNPEKCAAEIVRDYYLPDDEIATKNYLYAWDRDFAHNKIPIAKKLDNLIAFFKGDEYKEKKQQLVKLLSKGIFKDEWITTRIIEAKGVIKQQKESVHEHIEFIKIEDLGILEISFAEFGASQITRIIEDSYNGELCVGIDTRYNEVNIHSNIVNCREVAVYYYGGGHINRAGFYYNDAIKDNKINPNFLHELITTIKLNKLEESE